MMSTFTLPAAVLRRGLPTGSALITALLLSACATSTTTPSGSTTDHGMTMHSSAPASTKPFNDADMNFAQSMISHHEQAVQMAALADSRAANPQVKHLAATIKAAQQPEIDTMSSWPNTWGKPVPMPSMGSGMSGMDHAAMPGMMSSADMATLMAAKGATFDKQFLTMMIGHHQGAISMAQQEATRGSNIDAKALAQKIVTDQQAQITTMKAILAQL